MSATLDLDRLLRLRLVIARFGEMDGAKWWNTKGQLGRYGVVALGRGFPRTHFFAQARSVFAVAAHRCAEVFHPPRCVTLWRLPEDLEEELDARWEHWLDDAGSWSDFFGRLGQNQGGDLLAALCSFDLIGDAEANAAARLTVSAEGRAVQLPATFRADDVTLTLLAAAFAHGRPGALAVPYARLEG
ncbi:BrxE family protein [Sorangium sp. So ce295]|uniref:BrxE family protein n=1 Tax=Sorangium sp. So ce295 TaxID=3133295 RepID=UPI003F63C0BD